MLDPTTARSSFEEVPVGAEIRGEPFTVTRDTIRAFCDASLDYNPLHLDDDYMEGSFGKTRFGGVIMHGMTSFGLLSRMLCDWALRTGAVHRRLETRWVVPVRPGDTIRPFGTVKHKTTSRHSGWYVVEVQIHNQHAEQIAVGEALLEAPIGATGGAAGGDTSPGG